MPSILVPLLSEQSLSLVRNRLLETLTGGFTFYFNSELPVSRWVYVIQLLVHQLPFLVGIIFTAFVESNTSSLIVASCLCGATMTGLTLLIQAVSRRWSSRSRCLQRQLREKNEEEEERRRDSPDKVKMSRFDLENTNQTSDRMPTDELIAQIIPKKKCKFNYLLHSVCNGLLTGYGVVYFLPSTLESLYRQVVISYAVFVLGWQTICIAAFSLTAHPPSETATFMVVDHLELKSLMRPFYVGLCYLVDLVFRLYFSVNGVPNAAMHLFFNFFSLMWFLNVFPPLNALFLWLLEQIHVWLAGGSPSASKSVFGLLFQLFLWICLVLIVCFIPKQVALLVCAEVGYTLSLDLGSLWRCICSKKLLMWDISDLVFFGSLMMAVLFLSVVLYFLITPNSFQLNDAVIFAFGVALSILYLINVLTTSGQSVYLFGGLVRNCIYPRESRTRGAARRLQQLQTLGNIRSVVMTIVAPLVIIVFVTLTENLKLDDKYSKSWLITFLRSVAIVRAFRWSWQQTESALFELSISFFLIRYTGLLTIVGCSSLVYLLMAVVLNRIFSALSKCHMICLLLVASTQEKHRRPYSCLLFVLNVLFCPVVMAVAVLAAILDAPVLSLYTLPIFWIGFPRPSNFWPKQEHNLDFNTPDSVYYEEIVPNLLSKLNKMFLAGVLGNVITGDHFLLRYESRLVWLSVAESGFGYHKIILKGLELQQTSCHSMEATAVDTILEWAFEESAACRCTRTPSHVFSPKCYALVETYVDSRSVLTGVIDSPDTLRIISDYFPKCLIWVLVNRMSQKSKNETASNAQIGTDLRASFEREPENVQIESPSRLQPGVESSASTYEILVGEEDDDEEDPWKDEKDLLGSPTSVAADKKSGVLFHDFLKCAGFQADDSLQLPGSVDDDIEKHFAQQLNLRPPVLPPPTKNVDLLLSEEERKNTICFPGDWLKSPPLSTEIMRSIESEFPSKWFQYVWKSLANGSSPSESELKVYRCLVLTCHYIVNQLVVDSSNRVTHGIHPSAVNRIFQGELPWSASSDWLTQNASLLQLVVTAYRYALKVALDHVLLNDVENESDLKSRLDQFDRFWVIVPKVDLSWREGIKKHVPNLFTMSFDPEKYIYSSHLLTRRPMPIYIGKLNKDAVKTIWSTLNLELLYLANDDEERYSIQAHPVMLRNLSVQAADPPLGYSIFITEPLLVKVIPTLLMQCR